MRRRLLLLLLLLLRGRGRERLLWQDRSRGGDVGNWGGLCAASRACSGGRCRLGIDAVGLGMQAPRRRRREVDGQSGTFRRGKSVKDALRIVPRTLGEDGGREPLIERGGRRVVATARESRAAQRVRVWEWIEAFSSP